MGCDAREGDQAEKLIWGPQIKDWEAGFAAQDRIEDIGVQAQRAELQRQASRAARMAELTGGSDEEVAQKTYQTRVNLALQLAGIEVGSYRQGRRRQQEIGDGCRGAAGSV